MLASRDSSGSRRPCASPPPLATLHLGDTNEGCLVAEHRVDGRLSPTTPPASTGPASSTPRQPASPSLSASVSAAHGGSGDCGGDACSAASSGEEDLRPFPPSTGPSILTAVALSTSDGTWAPCLRTPSPETVGDERQSGPPSTASEGTPSDRCTKDGQGCDGLDPNDEDADDYLSCCTGPPSPLCSLSPASVDKEAEGRSDGRSDDLGFDDFATSLDEDNFDGCDDAFDTFAAGGASVSAGGETERTRVFESLGVAEVDFQKLTKIVLDSALSLYDLPSERSPCPASLCGVGFPKSANQSASRDVSPSDRVGGDKCVELLDWFASAPPFVNSKGEALAKFEWKSSVLCKLYSAAVNPSRVSRFVRVEAPSAADASDRICVGSMRSAGAWNEPATPCYQIAGAAGFPPPSPTRSAASSQSGANAAAAALSAASKPKHLDLKHAERLCSVSKAALTKRSAAELGFLRDHYAEVLKLAVAHLSHWLDSKEQAVMDSEMNHKVIETLVLQAQKAVRENVTVGRDAKRRKPKPLRNNLKPPKVKQAERTTTGWQVPM